jgi:hypothetical protein
MTHTIAEPKRQLSLLGFALCLHVGILISRQFFGKFPEVNVMIF